MGTIPAIDTSITTFTKLGSRPVYDEKEVDLGDVAPQQIVKRKVKITKKDTEDYNPTEDHLKENVTLSYKSQHSFLRFWCRPIFTARATYEYHSKTKEWTEKKRWKESNNCV